MHKKKSGLLAQLDLPCILFPLAAVVALCVMFLVWPERSTQIVDLIRAFLGNRLGFFYIVLGFGVLVTSLYMAFSRYGNIRLGNTDQPEYSNFKWGAMIFTGVFAADIVYYSLVEWALYANEPRIAQLGGIQDWASTYPLLHWGPIPWAFYVVLAVAFGFMLHVRGRTKQKFSEACRPLLGSRVDGLAGRLIDLVAIIALLCGTATTFSAATPLLAAALSHVFGFNTSGVWLTVSILLCICAVYLVSVLKGIQGHLASTNLCTGLFFLLMAWVLFLGGQTVYIIETGITSIGNLTQNFISLSLWMDPLRESGDGTAGFAQNWTIFYWAYWMAWCTATPFFIGVISRGRTIRNTVLGTYAYGLSGTFLSFIVFGNYGLGQQMTGRVDMLGILAADGPSAAIVSLFETLPLHDVMLMVLFALMVLFYSTTFDTITLVVSAYSYKNLSINCASHKAVRAFWAIVFIIFPIGLIFAENTINSLQSVSIIAAFPIGIIIILILVSFFKDAALYLRQAADKPQEEKSHADPETI